jgi:hypothetical protein
METAAMPANAGNYKYSAIAIERRDIASGWATIQE